MSPAFTLPKSPRVASDMLIKDALDVRGAVQILTRVGLPCVSCHINVLETLEEGLMGHGQLDREEVDEVLAEINALADRYDYEVAAFGFSITPKALEKLSFFAEQQGITAAGLKILPQESGCCSVQYGLDLQEQAAENEKTVRFASKEEEIDVFVPAGAWEAFIGAEIDFLENEQGAGFKVENPQAKSACSCRH